MVRTATALALVLAIPATASAQKCVARPGTAALDQYCETVPTEKGAAPARRDSGQLDSVLPPAAAEKLERHGEDGQAVLALPTGGSPRPPSGSAPSGTQPLSSVSARGAGTETDAPPDAPSSNPVSALFTALGGVGALGWGVLLALLATAAVAGAAAFSGRAPARDLPPAP